MRLFLIESTFVCLGILCAKTDWLNTISPNELALPLSIIELIPPQPQGYNRSRENFKSRTGITFDYLAAAESITNHTLTLLFNIEKFEPADAGTTWGRPLPAPARGD